MIRRLFTIFRYAPEEEEEGPAGGGGGRVRRYGSELTQAERDTAHQKACACCGSVGGLVRACVCVCAYVRVCACARERVQAGVRADRACVIFCSSV